METKVLVILISVLSILLSSVLVKQSKGMAYCIVLLLWLFFLMIPYKNYQPKSWFLKMFLLYLGLTAVVYSMWNRNKLVDEYVIPILFLINILIIFPICLFRDKNKFWRDILKVGIVLYLLYTLKFGSLKMRNGKFANIDKKWLMIHLFLLLFIYQDNNCMSNNIGLILKPVVLVSLYPLLFPLNEFLIHRLLSLCIVGSINWYKLYN
tara:strand:+ start:2469 stop:3092 length:624 start_codon:yes stop_codon:yes gene_type:complete